MNQNHLTEKQRLCLSCMECCRYLGFKTVSLGKESKELLRIRGVKVFDCGNNKSFLAIPSVCPELSLGGCKIYEKRPAACRNHDGRNDPMVDCLWKVLD